MEMIRLYNRKTGEILEKTFTNPEDADDYEVILDFLMAEYERYHNGERLIDIRNEDMDWWTIALSKLKNKFILDKMQIIEKGIKDGKIYN